jgi:hypothetical protein
VFDDTTAGKLPHAFSISLMPSKQLNGPVIRQAYIRGPVVLNDIQPVTTSLKKMALAVDKFALRLPLLISEVRLLTPDP